MLGTPASSSYNGSACIKHISVDFLNAFYKFGSPAFRFKEKLHFLLEKKMKSKKHFKIEGSLNEGIVFIKVVKMFF